MLKIIDYKGAVPLQAGRGREPSVDTLAIREALLESYSTGKVKATKPRANQTTKALIAAIRAQATKMNETRKPQDEIGVSAGVDTKGQVVFKATKKQTKATEGLELTIPD